MQRKQARSNNQLTIPQVMRSACIEMNYVETGKDEPKVIGNQQMASDPQNSTEPKTFGKPPTSTKSTLIEFTGETSCTF